MYANTKKELLSQFLDGSAGDTYSQNRLVTEETDDGNVALIGYGWLKLAEFDPDQGAVTIFTGHRAIESQTVNRYLNDVARRAEAMNVNYSLSGESPTEGQPNAGSEFIGHYVSMTGGHSPVERDAVQKVVDSLSDVA